MAEEFHISTSDQKEERYKTLVPQVKSLIQGEPSSVANLANVAAAIQQTFQFLWTGFYISDGSELVLGPFQGPVACTRIAFGKGVCGTAWKEKKTLVVPDVNQFPGHIACSSLSKSEIVVPLLQQSEVIAVLDIDSRELNTFDNIDRLYLEEIAGIVSHHIDFKRKPV